MALSSRLLAASALLALSLAGCQTSGSPSATATVATATGATATGAAAGAAPAARPACTGDGWYIPQGTFPSRYPAADVPRRRWYSLVLYRMEEPSLACGGWDGSEEVYRLLWLQTFAHPLAVRVTRRGAGAELVAVELDGTGFAEPGVPVERTRRTLSPAEWGRLQQALRRAGFWSLPTSSNLYGVHGSQWIVEARRNGRYHIVDRWSPRDGTYRALGLEFMALAGRDLAAMGGR